MELEAVIGLEVHAQLRTASKIFCGCSTAFGAPPNSHTCPVCLGLPGALPVLNSEAVTLAVATALALGCRINLDSRFARKNYFYPDLPKGYQISQYDRPLAEEGSVTVLSREQRSGPLEEKSFRILRLHMEEDAGKSVHQAGQDTLVNLNRTGVPLVEIVTQPDLRSAAEAHDFLQHLRRVLLYLEVCDGNMEEGSLRCDANVSLRPAGSPQLGTKTEIKNVNSFRFLRRALEHEIERQAAVLAAGGTITQETRLWDEQREVTVSMRSKEEAHDYRYFPDPDLLPLRLTAERVDEIASGLPELPDARCRRLQSTLGLDVEDARYLTRTRETADYFEQLVAEGVEAGEALNWVRGHLSARLKQAQLGIGEAPVPAAALAELAGLVDDGTISGKIAKEVFDRMWESGGRAADIVASEGLAQISDESAIEAVARSVLEAHPQKVKQYRGGKEGLLGFFVGQVMRQTGGRANPATVQEVLRRALGSGS